MFDTTSSAIFANSDFIFNNGHGAATLEFWLKIPSESHNNVTGSSIFWTRIGDTDANRFNIYAFPLGVFNFDYREPNGTLHGVLGSFNVPLDTWTHIAIVRTVDSSIQHTYRTYRNGILITAVRDMNPNLPTSMGWTLSGRNDFFFDGFVDEIRFSDNALRPDQFLNIAPNSFAIIGGRVLLQTAATQAYPMTFDFRPTDGSQTFSRTIILNADGTYQISDIPRKNYRVWIKGTKWLAKTVLVNATNVDVSDVNANLLTGDANNDNFVDIADLLLLIAAYNKVSPASGYSEAADFDGNGSNDITDLLFLIVNYNKQGDS